MEANDLAFSICSMVLLIHGLAIVCCQPTVQREANSSFLVMETLLNNQEVMSRRLNQIMAILASDTQREQTFLFLYVLPVDTITQTPSYILWTSLLGRSINLFSKLRNYDCIMNKQVTPIKEELRLCLSVYDPSVSHFCTVKIPNFQQIDANLSNVT